MAADAPDPRTASGERGSGRFGLWSGGVAAILRARPEAFEPLVDPALSEASRWLDVNLLAVALERLVGVDAAALAAGGRLLYVKDAREAVALVDGRRGRERLPAGPDAGGGRDAGRRGRRGDAAEVDLLLPQGADRPAVRSARVVVDGTDRACGPTARRARRWHAAGQTPGPAGPQGRDRHRGARPLHRVVAARAPVAAPAALPAPRRARRFVAVGALPGLLRAARLGGPRPQPARPLLVGHGRPREPRLRQLPRTTPRQGSGARPAGRGDRARPGRASSP